MTTPAPTYPTPDENTPTEHLLDMIDDCLRNGRLMTRGNLAFSLLCERLDYDRDNFPTFRSWYDKEEEADLARERMERYCGSCRSSYGIRAELCNGVNDKGQPCPTAGPPIRIIELPEGTDL